MLAVPSNTHDLFDLGGKLFKSFRSFLSEVAMRQSQQIDDMHALCRKHNARISPLRCPMLFKIHCVIARVVRCARENLRKSYHERLEKALQSVTKVDHVDEVTLERLL